MSVLPKLVITVFALMPLVGKAKDDASIKQIFNKYSVNGTLIVSSYDDTKQYIYNKNRSEKGFVPASTFKILNTLIGLQEGVISNDTVFKWDGKDKGWSAWNKDQTLKSAFAISCVWCYQEIAKKVGDSKYLYHFNRINYGNKETGPNIQRFWLDGDLRITAQQQINFIKKVYKEQLPYAKQNISALKEIMVMEKKPNYTLYGKTGWSRKIGWLVGYVETQSEPWFFALNMDMPSIKQAPLRKAIVKEALLDKQIIF